MEQLEFDDFLERIRKEDVTMDIVFDAFTQVMNSTYIPNTLLVHPETWKAMRRAWRSNMKAQRRKRNKRKRGY